MLGFIKNSYTLSVLMRSFVRLHASAKNTCHFDEPHTVCVAIELLQRGT